MLLIYTPYQSLRLDYILKFIFGSLMGIEYRQTQDYNEYLLYIGPRISYSKQKFEEGIWIPSHDFLFSDKIIQIDPVITETSWGKIIFPSPESTRVPFDIFASSFYIVSRYEEYLPFKPDRFGRFQHTSSVLYIAGILSQPIVNIWVKKLQKVLIEKYPELKSHSPSYKFISTIDIDNAFAYREKGFFRSSGGYLRSLFCGKFSEMAERKKVLSGKETDPYDTYNFIKQIHHKHSIIPKVFILNGKYGKYDKNISVENPVLKKILKDLSATCEIGIHPSYWSNKHHSLCEEKLSVEKTIEKNISISRQHFLILNFPETMLSLIENGISKDFSMGYSSIAGYRAGTCSPFPFFNLKTNKETTLIIYPFTWMDRTIRQHMKLSPEEADNFISKNISQIKESGGTFVALWHNESLSDKGYWKGWQKVYENMINFAKT
jgi:hypothetical protein